MLSRPVASLLFLVVACTRGEKTPPARATPPEAAAPEAAAPEAAAPGRTLESWLADWPKAWTDPRVVAAIAEDCSFVPVKPPPPSTGVVQFESSRPANIFACDLGYEQSCNPDPCNEPQSTCEGGCSTTCQSCGETCAASCSSCKSTCTDDTCKKACATKCADCRQTCNRTMDRCVTGECNRLKVACSDRLFAIWKRNGCKARCATYSACVAGCEQAKDPASCRDACRARVAPGEKACDARCEQLGEGANVAACHLKCFETAPCASTWCMSGYGG